MKIFRYIIGIILLPILICIYTPLLLPIIALHIMGFDKIVGELIVPFLYWSDLFDNHDH